MGAQLSGDHGRRGGLTGARSRSYHQMAEINVTPFVDVMLVLLVVFMITAPLLTAGVPVDLPRSEARPIQDEDNKPLEVSINKEGKIFLGETEVEKDRLVNLLTAMTKEDSDRRIFIRGDQVLEYGDVMEILGLLNRSGFRKVALITEPSKQ